MFELNLPIVRSVLLSQFPNLICGMSTRQGGDSDSIYNLNLSRSVGDDHLRVMSNRNRFFAQLELTEEQIAYQKQVHESTITFVDEPGEYPSSDALITKTPMVGLSITVADCVPVLIYAPGENTIAAVHAGWRGTAQHITLQTLKHLKQNYQIDIKNTFAFIAPSADVCCYEVSEEIAKLFSSECISLSSKNKYHVNIKSANKLQLLDAGVPEENIEVSPYCTICKPSIFHSYRRDRQYSGRMLALIAMKEEI